MSMNFPKHAVLRIGALVALLVLLPAGPALAQTNPIQEAYQEGMEHLQAQRWEEAAEKFQDVIDGAEQFAGGHYYLGMAYAQMQRYEDAHRSFVRAAELDPGNGDAYENACRTAWFAGDFEAAWDHCIAAAQAGKDIGAAFGELANQAPGPSDYEAQLDAPRVFVPAPDISALLEKDAGIFGGPDQGIETQGADQRGVGTTGDPFSGGGTFGAGPSGDFGTQSGGSVAAEVQADLAEVRRRFALQLVDSPDFGVVKDQSLARWILRIEVDDVSGVSVGSSGPTALTGYLKLLDPASGEEVYSRPLELTNIASLNDVRNEVERYVGYMERWRRERTEGR